MKNNITWIAYKTIVSKEIRRFLRIWTQTILPPVITMTLYFVIFGQVMGKRIGNIEGHPYLLFIAPGLIIMSVITNSYENIVSSFFFARMQHFLDELLISPTPHSIILLGYLTGTMARAFLVAIGVTIIATLFTHMHVHSYILSIITIVLSSMLFALGGFANAIYAENFDDISVIPTFVITPLTFLGGVFYSVNLLPGIWRQIAHFNPILYIINAFRYSMLGISDVNISVAIAILVLFNISLFSLNLILLKKGVGLRE